jgi:hypothetical protein
MARSKLNNYDSDAEATAVHPEDGLDLSEAPEDVMGYGRSDR